MRTTIDRRLVGLVLTAALAAGACSSDSTVATGTTVTERSSSSSTTVAVPTSTALAPTAGRQEQAPSVPGDYSEVSIDYGADYAKMLAAGRGAVDALLAGDVAEPYARFGDELKALISEDEIDAIGQEARTDRVHFEAPERNAFFDGRIANGTISGSFASDSIVGTFHLEPSPSAEPTAPPTGRWEGEVVTDEAAPPTAFAVTFATEGEALTATIDVPEEGLSGAVLANVTYEPLREIGERLADSLIFRSPESVYRSQHAWGPWTLVMTLWLGDDGTITSLLLPRGQAASHPDPGDRLAGETAFRLPFDGVWLVGSGGPSVLQNHHLTAPSQRYGYDLAIWNHGGTSTAGGLRNEDYWAWAQPVLAPADGTVVSVLDGLEDNTPGVLEPEPHPAGNHVILQTGPGAFLFLAHFKQGSIQVVEGDRVTTGDVLGLTGNSGNSSEPHIHIHLQDEDDFFSPTAVGLPLPFTSYLANGGPVSVDSPIQGQLVQNDDE